MKRTSLIKSLWTIIIIVVLFIVYRLTLQICVVNGNSMNNTLYDNQMLVQSKLKTATYGDIVSIYSKTLDELLCKRVIAMEGDEVIIRGNEVYVNGILQDEPYAYYDCTPKEEYTFVVDEGCVFVMGDNRNNSTDSRCLGSISTGSIKSVYLFNLSNIIHANYNTVQMFLRITWVILFIVWLFSGIKFRSKVENKDE